MIIDSHVHIFYDEILASSPEASCEEFLAAGEKRFARILATADAAGIDKLCIIGEPPSRISTRAQEEAGANGLVLRLLEKFPDRLYGYIRVNPNNPGEAAAEMDRCLGIPGVIGVKVGGKRGCPGSLKADSPQYEPLMERLLEPGGIMLMHAWNKTTGNYEQESTPFEVAAMAEKFPNVPIQMAHLNGANYDGILAVAPFGNVFADTSGSNPEAGFLEWATGVMGTERIVFGSDATGRDFAVQIAKVAGADISEEAKAKILGGNLHEIINGRPRG